MTDKLRFSPTFNENVKLSFAPVDEIGENDKSPIWNSWPVVVKVVCNESSLRVWNDESEDFGNCFGLTLFGLLPAALFALVSGYFLAKPSPNIRLPEFPWQIWIKITANFLISLLLTVHLVSLFLPFASLYAPPYPALLVTYLFWIIAEVLHLFYLYAFMVPYKLFFKHGPSWMLMSWLITIPYYAQSIKSNIHFQRSVIDDGVWISILCLKLIYLVAHLCPHSPDFQRLPHRYQRAIRRDGRSSVDETNDEEGFEDRSLLLGESLTASYSRTRRGTVSPEVGNTLWTQLTLSWPLKMLRQGARFGINSVEQAMILPRNLKTLYVSNMFGVSELVRPVPLYTRSASSTSLDESNLDEMKSLWKRIAKCYGFKFAFFGVFQFSAMLANFAKPLTLSYLLVYMEGTVKDPATGFTYAAILIALSLFEGTLSVHLDYQLQRMKISLRSALVAAVYNKTILVARHRFEGKTIGEILTLMSTDCDRLANSLVNLHQLWCVPVQVALVLGLLYFQVGYVFGIGLGFSLAMIFVNHSIGKFIGRVNQQFMKAKDARIRLLSDIVYSISFIKMAAMEKIFKKKVEKLRDEEVAQLAKVKYLDAACVYFWAATPVILSIILFSIFSYFGEPLTAAKVFTSLSLINMLIFPLNAYPWVINGTMEGYVSLQRLQKMLDLTVIDYQQVYEPAASEDDAALLDSASESMYGLVNNSEVPFIFKLANASFSNSTNILAPATVKNINFKVAKGDLVGIAGEVGSGKSSLLLAIAGEIDRTSGALLMNDNHDGLGLVTQEPWIFNGTVRENIVFGSAYNPELYRKIIEATALVDDIESWPAGDLTWLGERGTTISGGQKARIHLARQVYQEKEIYLLDDIFASLDRRVASHIYENVVMGLLRDTTRVVVSHQIEFLRDARIVYKIENGEFVESGTPSEILGVSKFASVVPEEEFHATEGDKKEEEAEEKADGAVNAGVYHAYIKATGYPLFVSIVFFVVLMQLSKNLSDLFLTYWIHHDNDNNTSSYYSSEKARTSFSDERMLPLPQKLSFIEVFILIGVVNSAITLVRAFSFAKGGLVASKRLHEKLLDSVLSTFPSWFHKTPPGRLINRFSSDMNEADDGLPFILNIFMNDCVQLFGTVIVISYALPWFIVVVIPLMPFYSSVQFYYRHAARDLKRLAATSLSPIYQHFSETITGASTIRALRKQNQEILKNAKLLEANQRVNFSMLAANSWLSYRLTIGIGGTVTAVVTLIAIAQHEYATVDPSLIGLALSYALPLTGVISAFMRDFLSTELGFISVERIDEYSKLEREDAGPTQPVVKNWPRNGDLDLHKVHLQYPGASEEALKGVSLKIKNGEHVAIVGRTGSGKSSIFKAILRLEQFQGTIRLNDVVLKSVDVHSLRRNITTLSQDEFLFNGTIAENLDPAGKFSVDEINAAVDKVGLRSRVDRIGGLSGIVEEQGSNLSQGEKQLLCFARALLSKKKLILIDEATSSVDSDADLKIQQLIKNEFKDSTVLSIQHRLTNVSFYDRVLVMNHGKIEQFEKPDALIADKAGLFAQLLQRQTEELHE